MKTLLKILSGLLILLLLLMVVIPYFFKGKILERAEKELNNSLNAHIVIGDVSLSLFKSFPNLFVELQDIIVTGQNEFEEDTLAAVGRFYTGVNAMSALFGEEIHVDAIVLDKTKINALVLKNGKANWDIAKETDKTDTEETAEGETSGFTVKFEEVRVENLSLLYDDASLNTRLGIDQLNLILTGDFSAKSTNLDISSRLSGVDFEYEKVKYVKKTQLGLDAVIAADLENMLFTFKDNSLTVNDLEFGIDGNFGINEDAYTVDMKLDARKTNFKTILSMIPDVFKTDLKGLETSGKLNVNAYVKGEYRENYLPAFGANLQIEDARFKYPELPESVENIFVDVQVYNPGGDMDKTVTDIKKFHLEIAHNPFDAKMQIKTPISDPEINGAVKGTIDFTKVKHAIPMDNVDIAGKIVADVNFKGRLSSIEKEQYEEFMAKGDVRLNNFKFTAPEFPYDFKILSSVFNFTPKYIVLSSFDSRIGKSDLKLTGKISNYIPYALKDKTLYGDFSMTSNWMDLNEFMEEKSGGQGQIEASDPDTIPFSVIEIPSNLNLKLVSQLKKVRFDKMDIENVNGTIEVKNSTAILRNLKMNMLKGAARMNGSYSTRNIKQPFTNFDIDIDNFDVKSAYHSLSMVKEMIPIALNCEGKVSADMTIASRLDTEMNPVLNTMNGKGSFHSRNIIISDNAAFDAMAQLLKNNSYKRISISQFDMKFLVKNGNVEVPPFKAKVAGHESVIYGTQSVEGKLDFTMEMKVPKDELGREVNQYFDKLPGYNQIPTLDVAVKITGTISNPKVDLDLSKAIAQAREAVMKELERRAKEQLKKKGDKLKEELKDKFKDLFK